MKYIECPQIYLGNDKSLFLGGGISNCPDWQSELVNLLKDENIVLINPRRKNYLMDDPNMEKEQISWEYTHLEKANATCFWFPRETLCPITLYELGKQSKSNKQIFIGVHPNYARKSDIEIQMSLARPEINIVYSLEDLSNQIKDWNSKNNFI